jgi:transposase
MGRKEHASNRQNRRKKNSRSNVFLGIDIFTAECFFAASRQAKSEDLAAYFAEVAKELQVRKIIKTHIFLDNNPTHKQKLQRLLKETLTSQGLDLQLHFHFIAPYSPKLNPVEYVIHLIRQKILHHADCKKDLQIFENEIKQVLKKGEVIDKEKMVKILEHIEKLVK